MEDQIRGRLQIALRVETPPGLRHTVISAVPMERHAPRTWRLSWRWVGGLVALILSVAIIVGVVRLGGLNTSPVRPAPAAPGLMSPEGIAIGPDGSVYVSDYMTGALFHLNGGRRLTLFAGTDTHPLAHPVGIAVERSGTVYVAEAWHGDRPFAPNATPGDILRIDSSGNTIFAPPGSVGTPQGLALDSLEKLYFAEYGGRVGSLDRTGQVEFLEIPPLPGPVVNPGYTTFDAAGNFYFTDKKPSYTGAPGGCRIIRMTPDKSFSIFAGTGTCGFSGDGGPATRAELDDPNGLAFDSRGNLYFSDANNHRIRRIDPRGVVTTVAGTGQMGGGGDGGQALAAQLDYPFGIAITPGGLLYFSDATCTCDRPSVAGRVRLVNLQTGVISTAFDARTPVVRVA